MMDFPDTDDATLNMRRMDNMRLVYELTSQGKLSNLRKGGTLQIDDMALHLLSYLALHAMPLPDQPDGPARLYKDGFAKAAWDLGLVAVPDDGPDPHAARDKRWATARSRVSRARSWLQKQGLLAKIKSTEFGHTYVYVLTIGDGEENRTLVSHAKKLFDPETAVLGLPVDFGIIPARGFFKTPDAGARGTDVENQALLAQAKERFALNLNGANGNPPSKVTSTNIALVVSTMGRKVADIRPGDPFPHPRADLLMVLTVMAMRTYDPDTAPAGRIPRLYADGWEYLADRLGLLHPPHDDMSGGKDWERLARGLAEAYVRARWGELVSKGLLARVGDGPDAPLLLLLGDADLDARLLDEARNQVTDARGQRYD